MWASYLSYLWLLYNNTYIILNAYVDICEYIIQFVFRFMFIIFSTAFKKTNVGLFTLGI